MNDRPTPATDRWCGANFVTQKSHTVEGRLANYARGLERQRDEARERVEKLRTAVSEIVTQLGAEYPKLDWCKHVAREILKKTENDATLQSGGEVGEEVGILIQERLQKLNRDEAKFLEWAGATSFAKIKAARIPEINRAIDALESSPGALVPDLLMTQLEELKSENNPNK